MLVHHIVQCVLRISWGMRRISWIWTCGEEPKRSRRADPMWSSRKRENDLQFMGKNEVFCAIVDLSLSSIAKHGRSPLHLPRSSCGILDRSGLPVLIVSNNPMLICSVSSTGVQIPSASYPWPLLHGHYPTTSEDCHHHRQAHLLHP